MSCYTKARQHEGVRKRGVLKNTCSWKSKIKSKCNLKSRLNPWKIPEKYVKSELLQKDFSSIVLKLRVTSLDSPEMTTSVFIHNNALEILILIIYSHI